MSTPQSRRAIASARLLQPRRRPSNTSWPAQLCPLASSGPRPISRRDWLRLAGSAGLTGMLSAGCGGPATPQPGSTPQLTLQLNWIPDAQHGGFFAARELGLFRRNGLEVQIQPGGPDIATLPKLVMGQVDFAIANADQVLLARAQEADIVAVFAALQQSPRCVMVHAASGIRDWEQLQDVTLALGEGKAFAEYLKHRLPLKNVRIVSYAGDISKWLVDPAFAQQGYVFSEPLLAELQGGDPHVLMVSELGFNPYTSVLVTHQKTLEERADQVQAVVAAVRQGWLEYLDAPTAINQVILQANPLMELEVLEQAAATIRPLCLSGLKSPQQLGTMTTARWLELQQKLLDLGLLDQPEADISRVFQSIPPSADPAPRG